MNELNYYYFNPKRRQLEILLAWLQFYQNSSNLAVKVKPNEQMFVKTQQQVEKFLITYYKKNT